MQQKENSPILVLAGNPNVGKSVLFSALTGIYTEVSNFPGTTVELTKGSFAPYTVIDSPGVFGLSQDNDEERVTLSALSHSTHILNVLDGTNLSRDLFLTLQLMDLQKPMLLAVNMMDEVQKNQIRLDLEGLSLALSLPIFPVCGKQKQGIPALLGAIAEDAFQMPPSSEVCCDFRPNQTSDFDDATNLEALFSEINNEKRRAYADRLTHRFTVGKGTSSLSRRIGTAMLLPFSGSLITFSILTSLCIFMGKFVAGYVVTYTQTKLMGTYYFNGITEFLSPLLTEDSLFYCLLMGEYGILTMVPIYLFGLILPLVAGFYLCLSLLEDSGLLSRMAVLLDKYFSALGLNGKAVIPLLLGFGCITMSLITTRILGSKRERLIATALLCIAVPCSAQFAVILTVACLLPPAYLFLYIGVVFSVFFFLGFAMNCLLPGTSGPLFLVLPPLRLPDPQNVLKKTALKANHFLLDAGPMFLLGGLILSLLNYSNGFMVLYDLFAPLTETLLGLPRESATFLLLSVIKRDLGAAQLYSMVSQGLLNDTQLTVALTVMTLSLPCFASIAVLFKEQGLLTALSLCFLSLFLALALGSAASALLIFLPMP